MASTVEQAGSVAPVGTTRSWWSRSSGEIGRYVVLVAFLLIFLLPFVWIWSAAFKKSIEIARDPFGLPETWRWQNIQKAWTVGHFDRYMGNTILYCVAIVGGVVALSCLAGYALALLPVPARGAILMTFVLGLMVPFQS